MKDKVFYIINRKWIWYSIAVLLVIFLYCYDLTSNFLDLRVFICISIFLGILIGILMIVVRNKEFYKVHFILCITIGCIYIVAAPLFTGSDEQNHYYRIYEITEGIIKTPVTEAGQIGAVLPKSLLDCYVGNVEGEERINRNTKIKYSDIPHMLTVQLGNESMQYGLEWASGYANTALYSPVSYLPHIIGFMIAKFFSLGPYLMGVFGKVLNLVVYATLTSIAIKNLHRLKTFMMIVLLCPMMICSATTLSADAFTYSLIILLVSCIDQYRFSKKRMTLKNMCGLAVVSLMLAGCKIVYLPILFLLVFIPVECFSTVERKIKFCIFCILIGGSVSFLWLNSTQIYFDVYYSNTNLQKANILQNLFWFLSVVFRTYMINFTHLAKNMFAGNEMYHVQIPVYDVISVSYILLVVTSFFVTSGKGPKAQSANLRVADEGRDEIKSQDKVMLEYEKAGTNKEKHIYIIMGVVAVILMLVALTTTAIYIQCTANFIGLDYSSVVGLQGRYFLPLILLLPLVVTKEESDERSENIFLEIMLIEHLYIILQMILVFSR